MARDIIDKLKETGKGLALFGGLTLPILGCSIDYSTQPAQNTNSQCEIVPNNHLEKLKSCLMQNFDISFIGENSYRLKGDSCSKTYFLKPPKLDNLPKDVNVLYLLDVLDQGKFCILLPSDESKEPIFLGEVNHNLVHNSH